MYPFFLISLYHEKRIYIYFVLLAITILFISACNGFKEIEDESEVNPAKPYTYWWWMGNAVDTATLAYNLEMMDNAGVGGAHIVPIYGVKGYEDEFLEYLSPKWVDMVKYTSRKAGELGMEIDMTLGTGWCYGGSWVEDRHGIMSARIDKIDNCTGNMSVDLTSTEPRAVDTVLCVLAELGNGERLDLTSFVSDHKITVPGNISKATLYVLHMFGPMTNVKRAAPGAEGPMLNPLSVEAFNEYVKPYEDAFHNNLGDYISSIYHDSYEYYNAKWSPGLFAKFEDNRGYKLEEYLPELYDKGKTELSRRVIADYRQTVFELHREYITALKDWADKNDVTLRNQAHGSPTNWLDVYPIADIPETESFGSSPFKIPGFDRDSDYISVSNVPDMDVYKFASSAAHVTGRSLVSCETHTWLREHFRVALSHCKPELDKLFVSGINHVYYHGTAYSPKEESWPGWLFYASTNFAPSNSQYAHFSAQNKYIENCQGLLQSAGSDNEIVVYFPFQDILHNCNVERDILLTINVHNPQLWFYGSEFEKTLTELRDNGFCCDYISDLQLLNSDVEDGSLKTTGNNYNTLVIPKCEYMPLETIEKLNGLAEAGVKIVFTEDLPVTYSGYDPDQELRTLFEDARQKLVDSGFSNLEIISNEQLSPLLEQWGNKKEQLASYNLDFIRERNKEGCIYFISNLNSGKDIDEFIPIASESNDYIFYDPITGKKGFARVSDEDGGKSALLQLKQGESIFLFTGAMKSDLPDWEYTGRKKDEMTISGSWRLEFLEGGPELPESVNLEELVSWTELSDTMASYFSGLARYSTDFRLDEYNEDNKYILVFDDVNESVMIRLNGSEVITLFSHPFEADISGYLKERKNHIELEVANLSANRVRYLDDHNVEWRKFYNINFASISYSGFDASRWEPVESGLIGDVSVVCYEIK